MSDSLWPCGPEPARFLCPWDSSGKNTRVGYHFLLQGIFLTQRLNPSLLHWQEDSLPLSHQGSPLQLSYHHCCIGFMCSPFTENLRNMSDINSSDAAHQKHQLNLQMPAAGKKAIAKGRRWLSWISLCRFKHGWVTDEGQRFLVFLQHQVSERNTTRDSKHCKTLKLQSWFLHIYSPPVPSITSFSWAWIFHIQDIFTFIFKKKVYYYLQ